MSTPKDTELTSLYQHIDCGEPNSSPTLKDVVNTINDAFLSVMSEFEPLQPNTDAQTTDEFPPFQLSEISVFKILSSLNPSKATGPDGVQRCKAHPVVERPPQCSLTKAETHQKREQTSPCNITNTCVIHDRKGLYIVEYIKPAILAKVDEHQYGTVPRSYTTIALISMLHAWLSETDGNGATVRAVLFDSRKAFDLIDREILMQKLTTFDLHSSIVAWVKGFLTSFLKIVIPNVGIFHLESPKGPC